MIAVPLVGLRTVASSKRNVVLPAPLGPKIVNISPSFKCPAGNSKENVSAEYLYS
jgi:hypothetical protein